MFRITDLRTGKAFNVDLIKFKYPTWSSQSKGGRIKASLVLEAEVKLEPNYPHLTKKFLVYSEFILLLRSLLLKQTGHSNNSIIYFISFHYNYSLPPFLEIWLQ